MTMTPRLELRQSQALVMSPRLQQALRMLRMSNLELIEHVSGIVEGNPLLELSLPVPSGGGLRASGAAEGPSAIDLAPAPVTLHDHVSAQLRLMRAGPRTLAAAEAMAEELDEDGYLRVPLAELAERLGLDMAEAAAALALLQSVEPAGIGARNLAECFRLQLAERGELGAPMAALLDNLDLLAAGRRGELAQRCGVDVGGLGTLLAALRSLDPKPGAAISGREETVAVVVPDILVRSGGTGLEVEVNTATLPRVLVDNLYVAQLGRRDEALRQFVSECRVQANWLVRSLEQRARTILSVATAIVAHQERFFASGVAALRPLNQRALAEQLGLHESTVSRVTANKYLACDRGTFPLRSFFSQSLGTTAGDAVSAAAVQARIRSLIGEERAPRTLSDDRIVTILRAEGIDIARRTVAKYRDGMGIPSSVERRRQKSAGAVAQAGTVGGGRG